MAAAQAGGKMVERGPGAHPKSIASIGEEELFPPKTLDHLAVPNTTIGS